MVVVDRRSAVLDDALRSAVVVPGDENRLLSALQLASTNLPLNSRGEFIVLVLFVSVERVWRSSCCDWDVAGAGSWANAMAAMAGIRHNVLVALTVGYPLLV